ncbi:hypothetical protein [Roseateles cavernae]|uniref:hypothetical protein n=1 Tax=Roseateles cavernae TaxID=3153578 RepID=UPI0032E4DA18
MEKVNLASNLVITLTFSPDDLAWLQANRFEVPAFWSGHLAAPARGDVLRFAGHQFVIAARVWEHNGDAAVLRLYLSDRVAQTDETLH